MRNRKRLLKLLCYILALYSDEYKIERDREKEGAATKQKVEQQEEEKGKRAEQMRGEKRVVYVYSI